ncbi:MAG TPA: hypothetical protein VIL17_02450 [Coriobacteriia bacterium]
MDPLFTVFLFSCLLQGSSIGSIWLAAYRDYPRLHGERSWYLVGMRRLRPWAAVLLTLAMATPAVATMAFCVGFEAKDLPFPLALIGAVFGVINLTAVLQTPSATHPIADPDGHGDAL